jgi:hypothetical protein
MRLPSFLQRGDKRFPRLGYAQGILLFMLPEGALTVASLMMQFMFLEFLETIQVF